MRSLSRLVLNFTVAMTVAASSAFADTPIFRRGINLARIHNLPIADQSTPGAFAWPPFDGALAIVSDAELASLRALGFDFIRLPVAPAPFLVQPERRRRILMNELFATVRRLQDAGFGVLVDAHPDHSDINWSAQRILAKTDRQAFETYSIWLGEIALFLRNRPVAKTALGLMNEPQEECSVEAPGDWTQIQRQLYASVREKAPDLAIVLTTGCWSSPDALPYLSMRPYDTNTLIDLHYYRPHAFTHQGLPFANVPTRYLSGLAYPGVGADKNLTMFRSMQLIKAREVEGADVPSDALRLVQKSVDDYYDNPPIVDEAYVPSHFAAIRRWAEEQNVAPERIIIGEFGTARAPSTMPDIPGRLLWLRDVRVAAETNGFGWALWDYNAGDGYPGFGLVFDNESRKIDMGMVDALGLDRDSVGSQ